MKTKQAGEKFRAAIAAVQRPIAAAHGLPNAVYVEPELFEFDRQHVLGTGWAGLGFASDVPAPGDVRPFDFMGLPLLLSHDHDGALRVFHNVCSHRGMTLVTEPANVQRVLRCPYHAWCYKLDGSLKATPNIGGLGVHSVASFDAGAHGLREVRAATWLGVVFINLSGDAPAFAEHLAPLLRRWSDFVDAAALETLRVPATGAGIELAVDCNWKLAVENYCEAYHLPTIHPDLNGYSPLTQHYNIEMAGNLSGQGTYRYAPAATAGAALPRFATWHADKLRHAEYISFYPNTLLGIQADHVFVVVLQPKAAGHTVERLQLAYVGEDAVGPEFAATRDAVLAGWRKVFIEDVDSVEGMQRGRASPGFDGGVFSPVLDGPTHHFHTWLARRYAAA